MSSVKMLAVGMALLVAGVCLGAAGQAVRTQLKPSYLNTGLFTVRDGEQARFFVSLDDQTGGETATVLLQFFDQDGNAAPSTTVTLGPGRSGMLEVSAAGRFRAHARVLDQPRLLGARRAVVGTVEVSVAGSTDLTTPIRTICSIDEPGDVYEPSCPDPDDPFLTGQQ
jgi:hypothetical protein